MPTYAPLSHTTPVFVSFQEILGFVGRHPVLIYNINNKGIINIFQRYGFLVQLIFFQCLIFGLWSEGRSSQWAPRASPTVWSLFAYDHISWIGFVGLEIFLALLLFWKEQLERRADFTAGNSGMFLPGKLKCSVSGSSVEQPHVLLQKESHTELKLRHRAFL